MQRTNGTCPYCGAGIFNYDEREWNYGSPIRICNKCGEKYIDERFHEIAIEGIAPDALSVRKSVVAMLTGLFCVLASIVFTYMTGYYSLKSVFIGIIGLIMVICMLIDIILIKSGAKEKRFARLREESVQRLRDRNYANELAEAGYNVPGEYL